MLGVFFFFFWLVIVMPTLTLPLSNFSKLLLDPEISLFVCFFGGGRGENHIIGKLGYNSLKVVLCNCSMEFQFAIKSMQSEDFLSFDSFKEARNPLKVLYIWQICACYVGCWLINCLQVGTVVL